MDKKDNVRDSIKKKKKMNALNKMNRADIEEFAEDIFKTLKHKTHTYRHTLTDDWIKRGNLSPFFSKKKQIARQIFTIQLKH